MGRPCFTPGPWVPEISDSRKYMSWVRDPAMPQGADSIALVGASDLRTEQANVTLIAASPRLYGALEKAEAFVSGFEGDPLQDGVTELLAEIRAGLADARGDA